MSVENEILSCVKCEKNKYFRWYVELIEKRLITKPSSDYVELHHYVPLSLGGKPSDVVALTFKEHIVAHMLLVRFVSCEKSLWSMKRALNFMTGASTKRKKEEKNLVPSRFFVLAKTLAKDFGMTEEHRRRISVSLKGRKFSEAHISSLREWHSKRSEKAKEEREASLKRRNDRISDAKERGSKFSYEKRGPNLKKFVGVHGNKGKVFSEEHRNKLRIAKLGKKRNVRSSQ